MKQHCGLESITLVLRGDFDYKLGGAQERKEEKVRWLGAQVSLLLSE